MFLSQLLVNPGAHPDTPRPGVAWMKQTYRVHQRIWMAFPDTHRVKEDPFFLGTWASAPGSKPRRSEAGFLFRIEPEPPLRILVQSVLRPNWEYAFQNAPHLLSGPPQVREFEPSLVVGQTFRFRLVMQMVTRRTVPKSAFGPGQVKRRTEHPVRCSPQGSAQETADQSFAAWRERLDRAGDRAGFRVDMAPERLKVSASRHLLMKPTPDRPRQSFCAAQFDGLLECVDVDRLHDALVNGIGRGKAFGMGLLSLATVR